MMQQEWAAKRLLEAGAIAAAALCLWTLPAAAQSRQRPNDSSDGGGRVAVREAPSAPSGPSSGGAHSGGGGSDDGQRTARPVDGGSNEPERQRPRDRGGRGGGGRGGGGYYGGHYYGGWGWGGWGAWSWWPGYWGYYPPHYGPRYRDRYYDDYEEMGALDLDVAPGRAEVYVDGDFLGKVDAYDGFPRYLWLERGTYDVVFFLEGYKTVSRQITIYPGTVIDIGDRLEPGDAVRPEDLVTKSHERRDGRIRDERERRERIGRGDDEDWRERVRGDRERRRGGQEDDVDEDGRERREALEDAEERGGPSHGRVRLDIEPSDASVYLDGRFVGTAEQLSRSGLSVNPGEHQLSVVRPGHESEEVEFRVSAGEEVELEVELDREDN
jgi:hypothetical protein